ncbi:MAG TPA: ABC transporter permease [Bryobacteraceae bacterium]|nr:ABC transporter permease [Bryobacteraceae bacterium]
MGWIRRARALFRRDALSAEMEEELRFHLAMREEQNAEEGLPPEEARAAAQRRFGNATGVREQMREADLLTFVESIARDLRFAARMLAKHPGFTALAVLALAAGIGVNTAVFTAYKAFLLRPLDGAHPEELFNIYHSRPEHAYDPSFSYPDFAALRDHDRSFSGILAVTGDELTMTEAGAAPEVRPSFGSSVVTALGFRLPTLLRGGAEYVNAAMVSENFFSVLDVSAVRGRVFLERDADELGRRPQLLISENYWERRFDRQASVLGKVVKLNGTAFTIVGVTPRDFMGTFTTQVPDFWMPLRLEPRVDRHSDLLTNREKPCCTLIGRLAAGVTVAQAQAETDALANRLRVLHAPGSAGSQPLTIQVAPGSPFQRPEQDPKLRLVVAVTLGAVGLVLLIACANVAGMQLARSAARQREIGVRLSLGASRQRLIRQLLTESALLGLMAGVLSMILSFWSLRVLVTQSAAAMPLAWGTFALHINPDHAVFAYVFLVSLLAGILFGLAPALESSRPNLTAALKEEGARFAFRLGNRRLRNALMAFQVGACLFLLVMAGLLIHSSARALDVQPGYESRNVLELDVSFPAAFDYGHARQLAEVYQIREKLRALPEVTGVTVGRSPDGGGLRMAKVAHAGHTVFYTFVLPNYFDTLDIPLAAGRAFDGRADNTVVVSESAARRLWPGVNPIGRTVTLDVSGEFHPDGELAPGSRPYVVSGVARDTRGVLLDGSDSEKIYLPLPADRLDQLPILMRTGTDPMSQIRAVGMALHEVDPSLSVDAITLQDALSNSPQFVLARCSGLFASLIGLLGLLLASAGIFGSVSYAVVRRTREVGIRVALGATERDVIRLVLAETARPVATGLVAGLAAAAAAARLLRAMLNGLSSLDPLAFAGVSVFFLGIAMLAAFVPARRALRIDPMAALRCE